MTRGEAMRAVQMYDFAMEDTGLFLDTHPTNKMALQFYGDTRKKYIEAVEDYEEQFGALNASDVDVSDSWTWVNSPWPWEMED
ncbi:MAG: spore coat protein CotJB [Anaerovoracaceae bacterium]